MYYDNEEDFDDDGARNSVDEKIYTPFEELLRKDMKRCFPFSTAIKYIKFKDLVSSLRINKEELDEYHSYYMIGKFMDKKNPDYPKYQEYLFNILRIAAIYYELMKKDYYLSTEDIAKDLDVSLKTVASTVIPELDRLEFPFGEDSRHKSPMRELIYNREFVDSNGNTTKYVEGEYFRDKYRKKVLYSKSSYVRYLEKHMKIKRFFIRIPVGISNKKLSEVRTYMDNGRISVKSLFSMLLAYNKDLFSYGDPIKSTKHSNNLFNFEKAIQSKYSILYRQSYKNKYGLDKLIQVDGNSSFKSTNSLKVIFDTFYDNDVYRKIDNLSNLMIQFDLTLDLENTKKPAKRVVLDNSFLMNEFMNSLNNSSEYDTIVSATEDYTVEEVVLDVKLADTYWSNAKTENLVAAVQKDFEAFVDNYLDGIIDADRRMDKFFKSKNKKKATK